MSSKATVMLFIFMILTLSALPPPTHACGGDPCHRPVHPKTPRHKPPHHGGHPKLSPPQPPVIVPPIIVTPPPISPPVIVYPPPTAPSPPYWGVPPPQVRCPIDALKLGLCLDVLQGLVHVGIGNPIENICCPVIQGLLELEAAICLCTVIRLKLLNLNIYLPLALQVLATCGLTPPPGFVCPPLL
ncbi:36.4 kDa proline-rich protein [Prosopis cineraria]|uniref:36.4 kDa proline-rich protein n=1 Tax=Prosopis cineraria TaxID=364024 RepID=UPI002410AD14|nr:36.4 kDa proline-rich protein [Prosopis cineraria]